MRAYDFQITHINYQQKGLDGQGPAEDLDEPEKPTVRTVNSTAKGDESAYTIAKRAPFPAMPVQEIVS